MFLIFSSGESEMEKFVLSVILLPFEKSSDK